MKNPRKYHKKKLRVITLKLEDRDFDMSSELMEYHRDNDNGIGSFKELALDAIWETYLLYVKSPLHNPKNLKA